MTTKEEQQFVLKYVNASYYDHSKLLKYLSMHKIVGNEVFAYCDKRINREGSPTYSNWLDDESGHMPLSVPEFVKRVPFYFYTGNVEAKDADSIGSLHCIFSACCKRILDAEIDIEKIYSDLEYAFYHLNLPLKKIFNYWISQFGIISGDGFLQWCHYLHLCEQFGTPDYFPDRFITSYNRLLERAGLNPIVYEICDFGFCEPFRRDGKIIEFWGKFPCDENGTPIMKWIGIKATDIVKCSCDCEKSKHGYLRLEISPKTVIHVLNFYNRDSHCPDEWYQVYAGPLTMNFDHTVLKTYRRMIGYSQESVALAIGTTVRT